MSQKKLTAAQVRALLPSMPFNSLLGIKLYRLHSDGLTIECLLRRDLLNSADVLHGGVTATLADTAVGIALARHFGGRRPLTTVELKINYFRPVSSGKVFARAYLIRIGQTLSTGRVDLTASDGGLIATALVTYILLDARRPA